MCVSPCVWQGMWWSGNGAMSRSQPVCLQIYSSSLGSDLTESQRETRGVGVGGGKRVEKRWRVTRRGQERRMKRQKISLR